MDVFLEKLLPFLEGDDERIVLPVEKFCGVIADVVADRKSVDKTVRFFGSPLNVMKFLRSLVPGNFVYCDVVVKDDVISKEILSCLRKNGFFADAIKTL